MSQAWEDMTDIERASALELMGGKRQSNILSAIIQNFDTVEDVIKTSTNSANSALSENEKYLDSIEGKTNQFTNAVNTMWQDAISSAPIKFIVDLGTGFIKLADGIDIADHKIGNLWTTLGLLVPLMIKTFNEMTWGKFFSSLGESAVNLNTTIMGLATRFGSLIGVTNKVNTSLQNLNVGMFKQVLASNGVKQSNQQALLSLMGLQGATNTQTISEQQLTMAILETAVARKKLTAEQAAAIAQIYGLTASIKNLTVETLKNILTQLGVSNANKQALLSQMGLANAKNQQIISEKALTAATLEEATATRVLNGEQALHIATMFGLKLQTAELTAAKMSEMLSSMDVERQERKNIISKLGLGKASTTVTKSQIKEAISTSGVTNAEVVCKKVTDSLTWSNLKLGESVQKLIAKMGPMLTIAAIAGVIWGITKAIQHGIETLEEANEKLKETTNKFKEIDSELRDMKSQLKEVNSAIEELNSQESLSFTDQEELQRLKAQREELERSIALSETYKKQQQKNVNRDAQNAANKYKNANFKSGKGKEETQQGWAIGTAIAGGLIAAGSIGLAALTGGLSLSGLGLSLAMIGGAVGGGAIGGAAGYGIGTAVSEGGTDVEEAMDQMIEKRKSLEEKYNEAREAYYNDTTNDEKIAENYAKAEEELSKYDSKMAEHLDTMNSYYSQIDLNAETDPQKIRELRQAMNDFYDTQDKWAIAQGDANAKVNAFDRIFGENAEQEIKDAKKNYIDALNDGKPISFEEAFGSKETFNSLKQRLYDMGLYVTDAESYLLDYKKAADEASESSLYDLAGSVASAEDAISALSSALEEASESGQITAKTIQELNETFGSMEGISDEWQAYANIMMSGTASTKEMVEATQKLAEAWMDEKLINGPLDLSEKLSLISSLSRMGVENAYEYIEDSQKEAGYEKIVDTIQGKMARKSEIEGNKDYQDENGNFDENKLTEDLKKEYDQLKIDLDFSNPQNLKYLTDLGQEYGLTTDEVQKYIDKLKELADLETQLADLNNKTNKANGLQSDIDTISEVTGEYDAFMDKYGIEQGGFDTLFGTKGADADYGLTFLGITEPMTDEEYNQWVEDFNKMKSLYDKNGAYSELIKKKKELEQELNNLNIDPNASEEEKKNLEEKINDLENQIKTEFTANIQLKVDLQNKSKLVDDIQSVFDALAGAQKEYNENGYFSVDTLQSLLELEPKYLALLYDENGNLNLNKQTLYEVAQARLTDLGIQAQKNILETATTTATKGSIDAMRELTDATYDGVEANEVYIKSQLGVIRSTLSKRINDSKDELYGQDESFIDNYIQGVTNQLNAVQHSVDIAKNNLANTLSSSGNTAKADTEAALEKLQKKYERQLSNLENQKTYLQNEVDRLEAEDKGVSKSYYEKQIAIEQKKMDVYKQERAALKNLLNSTKKGTDEWLKYLARCSRNITMYPFELLGNP